ncbi:hypothetical protein [Flavobacterium daejeonense]|uniref:hypothetical protein n=1 Tax=Flavobacterium daejeonense TaxID=350893 RepID=UPI00047DA6DB|nr:hypothetical protein [Flavobacterium daejeonense]
MKINVIILILLFQIISQSEVIGKYKRFGDDITLNSDYTYEYNYYFDTYSGWSKGNWKMKNDTIYLYPILIYDTLRIPGKKDSLILSSTKKPNLIVSKNLNEIYWPESSGEQTGNIFKKLFYKKGKLFQIDKNGKLKIKKERKPYYRVEEYYNPWFEKK